MLCRCSWPRRRDPTASLVVSRGSDPTLSASGPVLGHTTGAQLAAYSVKTHQSPSEPRPGAISPLGDPSNAPMCGLFLASLRLGGSLSGMLRDDSARLAWSHCHSVCVSGTRRMPQALSKLVWAWPTHIANAKWLDLNCRSTTTKRKAIMSRQGTKRKAIMSKKGSLE